MYKILYEADYGWHFVTTNTHKRDDHAEFATVDEAVKHQIKNSYGARFLIVQVVEWKADASLAKSKGIELG